MGSTRGTPPPPGSGTARPTRPKPTAPSGSTKKTTTTGGAKRPPRMLAGRPKGGGPEIA